MTNKVVVGVVHGKIIELAEDLGVASGQQVHVTVRAIMPENRWGEGLLRCAGALAKDWTTDDDRILEEIYQDRKRDARKEYPE